METFQFLKYLLLFFFVTKTIFLSNLVLKILIISFLKMSPAKFLSRVDVILEVTPTNILL